MERKKRGCNYTPAEKTNLLVLVNKYRTILENKETNAEMVAKKRACWEEVTKQFNSINSSGLRTWIQLRHLYDNIKQRFKHSTATQNTTQYYDKEILKLLETRVSDTKKDISHTDGTVCKNMLADADEHFLAMVAQVQPSDNSYENAAAFYLGDKERNKEAAVPTRDNQFRDNPVHENEDEFHDYKVEVIINDDDDMDSVRSVGAVPSTSSIYDSQESPTPSGNNKLASASVLKEKIKQNKNEGSIRAQYFRMRLRNARLENRYLVSKHKMEINKHKLEMQILRLRLKKLQRLVREK